jgi:aerobic carbon-monoxide dehydrogenase medium subunit
MARRHGDFAMVAVAASVTMAGDAIGDARLALINVADRPVRAVDAEAGLRGSPPTDDAIAAAADAATRDLSPVSDLHASAAYRRTVAAVLVRRALTEAVGRARSVA